MRLARLLLPSAALLLLAACRPAPSLEEARALAQRLLIADGHVDLPYRMRVHNFQFERQYLDVSLRTPDGDFDYVRAKQGGLDAPFMSIYLPSQYQDSAGRSQRLADSLIDMVEEVARRFPDKFALAGSPAEVEANFRSGKISLPMGMENGSGIEHDLGLLAYFHRRGIRYITLTHAKDNRICDSSYDSTATWKGLSPFGDSVVREMQRLGIMVDVSHISDSAFYDVMRIARAPVIASHSSCRAFTPGFERNMSDDMIRLLATNGGVMLINFGSTFVDGESRKKFEEMRAEIGRRMKADGIESPSDSVEKAYLLRYYEEKGRPHADVSRVADHIDHAVRLAGIDHVGFGSDFDGVGDSLPLGLKDVADYPNLIRELMRRGYGEEDLAKICGGNFLRVWRAAEAAANI
jgi:membrane dipeptidase